MEKKPIAAHTGRFRPLLEQLEQLERISCPGKIFGEMQVKIRLKQAKSIRELQTDTSLGWKRRIGMLYFHQLEDGGMVPRVVSEATNGPWITHQIEAGRIWIAEEKCICEFS